MCFHLLLLAVHVVEFHTTGVLPMIVGHRQNRHVICLDRASILRLYSLKICNTPSRKWDPLPDVVKLAIKPAMNPKNNLLYCRPVLGFCHSFLPRSFWQIVCLSSEHKELCKAAKTRQSSSSMVHGHRPRTTTVSSQHWLNG
jgi:hypothetical protein